jgi:hypothetical protein
MIKIEWLETMSKMDSIHAEGDSVLRTYEALCALFASEIDKTDKLKADSLVLKFFLQRQQIESVEILDKNLLAEILKLLREYIVSNKSNAEHFKSIHFDSNNKKPVIYRDTLQKEFIVKFFTVMKNNISTQHQLSARKQHLFIASMMNSFGCKTSRGVEISEDFVRHTIAANYTETIG